MMPVCVECGCTELIDHSELLVVSGQVGGPEQTILKATCQECGKINLWTDA